MEKGRERDPGWGIAGRQNPKILERKPKKTESREGVAQSVFCGFEERCGAFGFAAGCGCGIGRGYQSMF
jgi:hypothetical protein